MDASIEVATTPLRGDIAVRQRTNLMEQIHNAQFTASAAAAGCSVAKPCPDDGLDWVVMHRTANHPKRRQAQIEVQLRSTSQITPPDGDNFPFPVDNATFDRLTEDAYYQRLLIVCLLPANIEEWIYADRLGSVFQLRHLSYWRSLRNEPRTGNTQTTVRIDTANVFDDLALCEIMKRIHAGEDV